MKRRARLDYSTDYLPVGHDNNNSSSVQQMSRKKVKKSFCFRSSGLDRIDREDDQHEDDNKKIDRVQGSQESSQVSCVIDDQSEKLSNQEQTQSHETQVIHEKEEEVNSKNIICTEKNTEEVINNNISEVQSTDNTTSKSVVELIRKGKLHQYGNFNKYYEHRYVKKWNDPRIAVLKSDWFFNQRVLDIGCNDGQLTLQLAVKYFPKDILGVDIDYQLINNAVENLLILEKSQSKAKGIQGKGQRQQQQQQDSMGNQLQQQKLQQSQNNICNSSVELDSQEKEKRIKDRLSRLPACFLKQPKQQQEPQENQLQSGAQDKMELNQQLQETLQSDTINVITKEIIQEEQGQESIKGTIELQQQMQLQQPCNGEVILTQQTQKKEQQEPVLAPEPVNQEIQNNITLINNQAIQPQINLNQDSIQSSFHPPLPQRQRIINRFPNNIRFRTENYVDVQSQDNNASIPPSEQFDTICCFSTTKWIQLNFGDAGIKRLFDKVYNSLSINGRFLLEPQEWRSYKKKLNFSEEFKQTIKAIKLHPGEYVAYLCSTYPFELETTITPEQDANDKVPGFFKRPVYVFKKMK